jgi:hypothetical protein
MYSCVTTIHKYCQIKTKIILSYDYYLSHDNEVSLQILYLVEFRSLLLRLGNTNLLT